MARFVSVLGVVGLAFLSLACSAGGSGNSSPGSSGSGGSSPISMGGSGAGGGTGPIIEVGGGGGSTGAGDDNNPTTCAQAAENRTYIGCDFWPTITYNPVYSEFKFAVVVANGGSAEAAITVERAGAAVTHRDRGARRVSPR